MKQFYIKAIEYDLSRLIADLAACGADTVVRVTTDVPAVRKHEPVVITSDTLPLYDDGSFGPLRYRVLLKDSQVAALVVNGGKRSLPGYLEDI